MRVFVIVIRVYVGGIRTANLGALDRNSVTFKAIKGSNRIVILYTL